MSRDSEADPQAVAPGVTPPGTDADAAPPLVSRWVHHLADLARLRLDDAEAEDLARDLDTVLAYVRRVAEHTEDGAGESAERATQHGRSQHGQSQHGQSQHLPTPQPREADDAVEPGLPRPIFLANAPRTADGLLWVPAVHPATGRRAGRSEAEEEDGGAEPGEAGKDGG